MDRITITEEAFMPYRISQSVYTTFNLNTEIIVIGLVKDAKHPTGYAHVSWNNYEVPVVEIEIEGKTDYAARPIITNCVQFREGVIHNPENKAIECVDSTQTLLEDLEVIYPGDKYSLPEKFICRSKIMRGTAIPNGFAPIRFKKNDDTKKFLLTYIIDPIEWPDDLIFKLF